MAHFEELILQALIEKRESLTTSQETQTLLKLIVELRESSRKNSDFDTYNRITKGLEQLGIKLREETHVVASLQKPVDP